LAAEQLTAKIKTAASYHDIRVLDHIIVTTDAYYSFAGEGLLESLFLFEKVSLLPNTSPNTARISKVKSLVF
jgi:hypothetical protein